MNKIIEFSKFKPTRATKQHTFLDCDKENYQVAINKLMKIKYILCYKIVKLTQKKEVGN